ncbi:MAG: hypothetical protein JW795_12655 [Chitinivibrionales bacterium]|nr:hypothetical protein [Chitinivibrionales bacterium]
MTGPRQQQEIRYIPNTGGGKYIASVRVTDSDGMTSKDHHEISVDIEASFAVAKNDRTFNPYNNESIAFASSISGQVPVSIFNIL